MSRFNIYYLFFLLPRFQFQHRCSIVICLRVGHPYIDSSPFFLGPSRLFILYIFFLLFLFEKKSPFSIISFSEFRFFEVCHIIPFHVNSLHYRRKESIGWEFFFFEMDLSVFHNVPKESRKSERGKKNYVWMTSFLLGWCYFGFLFFFEIQEEEILFFFC